MAVSTLRDEQRAFHDEVRERDVSTVTAHRVWITFSPLKPSASFRAMASFAYELRERAEYRAQGLRLKYARENARCTFGVHGVPAVDVIEETVDATTMTVIMGLSDPELDHVSVE